MKQSNPSQDNASYDYNSLFIAAIFLIATSQGIESIQTPLGNFIRGVVVGMSIACSLIGLVLHVQSKKKKQLTIFSIWAHYPLG